MFGRMPKELPCNHVSHVVSLLKNKFNEYNRETFNWYLVPAFAKHHNIILQKLDHPSDVFRQEFLLILTLYKHQEE